MYEGSCTHLPLAPRDSFTVREFLTIAINKKKAVKMAANEQDRKKAAGLQKALETVSTPCLPFRPQQMHMQTHMQTRIF
jgi:hypothetical protein